MQENEPRNEDAAPDLGANREANAEASMDTDLHLTKAKEPESEHMPQREAFESRSQAQPSSPAKPNPKDRLAGKFIINKE